jgi:hypothetical protein
MVMAWHSLAHTLVSSHAWILHLANPSGLQLFLIELNHLLFFQNVANSA